MPPTIVVVGGGVAGLVAARARAREGSHVILLEARPATGGAVSADALGGIRVDVGAEAFGVTRPETRALVDDLGLGSQVVSPRRSDARLLLADGLFLMPPALLGVPTDLDDPAFVAIVGEEAASQARLLDAAPVPELEPRMTLGDLVRSRLGPVVVDRLLSPVVAGVHAADPDLVEADAVLPGLMATTQSEGSLHAAAARMRRAAGVPGAAIAGLRGGMATLVTALEEDVRRMGVDVRLGHAATSIVRDSAGWRVMTADGDVVVADELMLAVDAPAAALLLDTVPEARDVVAALASVTVGDVALVAMVVRSEQLDSDPVGSGVLIAPGHPVVRAKAMTHASAKWDWVRTAYGPGRHLVRLSYGRDGRVDEPIADLPAMALADLRSISGADDIEVEEARVIRWDRSLVLPAPGHRDRVAAIRTAATTVPGLSIIGAGLGGNGLAGTIATAQTRGRMNQ